MCAARRCGFEDNKPASTLLYTHIRALCRQTTYGSRARMARITLALYICGNRSFNRAAPPTTWLARRCIARTIIIIIILIIIYISAQSVVCVCRDVDVGTIQPFGDTHTAPSVYVNFIRCDARNTRTHALLHIFIFVRRIHSLYMKRLSVSCNMEQWVFHLWVHFRCRTPHW